MNEFCRGMRNNDLSSKLYTYCAELAGEIVSELIRNRSGNFVRDGTSDVYLLKYLWKYTCFVRKMCWEQ